VSRFFDNAVAYEQRAVGNNSQVGHRGPSSGSARALQRQQLTGAADQRPPGSLRTTRGRLRAAVIHIGSSLLL
jgi:hypothetical protein